MVAKVRRYAHDPVKFCYICVEYILNDEKKNVISNTAILLYFTCFNLEIPDQDNAWCLIVGGRGCKMCIEQHLNTKITLHIRVLETELLKNRMEYSILKTR